MSHIQIVFIDYRETSHCVGSKMSLLGHPVVLRGGIFQVVARRRDWADERQPWWKGAEGTGKWVGNP